MMDPTEGWEELNRTIAQAGPFDATRLLDLSVALADALYAAHEPSSSDSSRGLLLSALRPRNIFFRVDRSGAGGGEDARTAVLVRFGNAEPRGEAAGAEPAEAMEGYAYTAPELSGRMGVSEGADERSDLYLLGLVLFKCATGRRPFEGSTALEYLHGHLAKRPPRVTQLNPVVPPAFEAIVERLLAKTPADRYQSAWGLLHDLRRCRDLHRAGRGQETFGLGERDVSARLSMPDAPCGGPTQDIARALDACRAAKESARPALIVVSGPACVCSAPRASPAGRPTRRQGRGEDDGGAGAVPAGGGGGAAARHLYGKADQYNRAPLAVARRREAVAGALGPRARLLVDVAPAAKLLLGPAPPPLPEARPAELQARLRSLVVDLLRAVSAPGLPTLVLLDDLQWADPETLSLADFVLASDLPVALCATYRSCEVSDEHAVAQFVRRAAKVVPVHELALAPLRRGDCQAILAATLKTPEDERSEALAASLVRKAHGNPFHTIQLLRALVERRALHFDYPSGRWTWSQAEVDAALLKVASCCGAAFDAAMLATITGASEEESQRAVQPALAAGLLVQGAGDAVFSFQHDKIQQAAHDMVGARERSDLCFRAGTLLRGAMREPAEAANLYEVANLLNACLEEPPAGADAAALAGIAELDLLAARRARRCAGYARGAEYAACGLRALALSGRDGELRPLRFSLSLALAECKYLSGAYAAAEAEIASMWQLAETRAERLSAYRLRIAFLSTAGRFRESAEAGLDCLRSLWGISFSFEATFDDVEAEMSEIASALSGTAAELDKRGEKVVAAFSALPECRDSDILDLMQVGADTALSVRLSQLPVLFCLIPARCLLLSLRHGRAPETALLAGILAQACVATDATLRHAATCAKVALALASRSAEDDYASVDAKTLLWCSLASVLAEPFSTSLEIGDSAYRLALSTGDVVSACIAGTCMGGAAFWSCEPLYSVHERSVSVNRFVEGKHEIYAVVSNLLAFVSALLQGEDGASAGGPRAPPLELVLAPAEGNPCGRLALDAGRLREIFAGLPCWAKALYTNFSIMLCVLLGDFGTAWRFVEELDAANPNVVLLRVGYTTYQDYLFATALAIGVRLSPGRAEPSFDAAPLSAAERAGLAERLRRCCDGMAPFADASPSPTAPAPCDAGGGGAGGRAGRRRRRWRCTRRHATPARSSASTSSRAPPPRPAPPPPPLTPPASRARSAVAGERLASLAVDLGLRRMASGPLRVAAAALEAWGAAPRAAALRALVSEAGVAAAAPPLPEIVVESTDLECDVLEPAVTANESQKRKPGSRRGSFWSVGPGGFDAVLVAPDRADSSIAAAASASFEASRSPPARPCSRPNSPPPRAAPKSSVSISDGIRDSSESDALNWETLASASQFISREIELGRLLERLMVVILEISGGERGFLVLEHDVDEDGGAAPTPPQGPPQYYVEASGEVVHTPTSRRPSAAFGTTSIHTEVLRGAPLAECGEQLCVRAVEWALATEQVAIVQDCSRTEGEGPLAAAVAGDGYVQRAGVRSLLALPISHKARAIGAVYLENRLLRGAFPAAAVDTLRILSSQMAVSIVNARLYERLRKSFAEIAAVLASAHDAIVTLDGAARVVAANPASERLWRAPRSALVGKALSELLEIEGPQVTALEELRAPPKRPASSLEAICSPKGRRGSISTDDRGFFLGRVWNGVALCPSGKIEVEVCFTSLEEAAGEQEEDLAEASSEGKSYSAFIRDVSARVRAEKQLQAVRRRWFAMVTHDLRTPLNGIAASHELIRDTPLSPEQREYVQHIGAATELLVSLMNDILEYSRLEEGGGAEPRPAPFDLVEHMEETAALLAGGARNKGVELLLLVPPAVPRLVVGESVRLRRIVMNYASNAIKFSERGGRVELRVDLAARGPGASATLRFTVTDTGIGIAKEHQHLLFRPYGQLAADDVTRMYGGTGLGLAIAKRLAESLGGAVGVESEPGRGSRFWATAVLQLQEGEQPEWPRLRGAVCAVLAASAGVADLLEFYVSQWAGRRGAGPARRAGPTTSAARRWRSATWRRSPRGRSRGGAPSRSSPPRPAPAPAPPAPRPRRRAQSEEAAAARVAAECIGAPSSPRSSPAPSSASPRRRRALGGRRGCFRRHGRRRGSCGRVRVLLVDDVRTNLVLAKKMLELGGCEVATARTASSASVRRPRPRPRPAPAEPEAGGAEAYRADPARVDLILLDVEMPVCDGRRACSQIRALEASGAVAGRVPIVYLSANAMPEDQEEALRLGGDAFLCKPIRRQVLMEAVARHSRRAPPPPPEPEAPAR
eukprot:tig00021462_g21570.t1